LAVEVAPVPEASSHGCSIHYAVDGPADGPALLLSNSLGTPMALWDRVLPWLTARFRVIRYDQRGHGRSDHPDGAYSIEGLGQDALAVLDDAGVSHAHVAGVSLGGMTALWLGIHAPHRVGRLVLANTGAQIGTADGWNTRIAAVRAGGMPAITELLLARWFTAAFRVAEPALMAEFRAMLEGCSVAGYNGCAAAVRDADLRDGLTRIRAATLVIVGADDLATPPSLGEALRDTIAGARLVSLPAAHLSNVERPKAFAEAVVRFLDPSGMPHG
jgi:3-oxoadipate enol-lactonase